jgi:hypothetical protein
VTNLHYMIIRVRTLISIAQQVIEKRSDPDACAELLADIEHELKLAQAALKRHREAKQ